MLFVQDSVFHSRTPTSPQ